MNNEYDIFISYRRDGGYETARIIYERLRGEGYRVFFDVEALRSGKFNAELYRKIEQCRDFIVVLAPGSLDRCENEDDWLRLEIAHAIKHDRNVVPVMTRGFEMPSRHTLPPDIAELVIYNGPKASHEYFDAFLDLLIKFLKSVPRATAPTTAAQPRQFFSWGKALLLFAACAALGVSALGYLIYSAPLARQLSAAPTSMSSVPATNQSSTPSELDSNSPLPGTAAQGDTASPVREEMTVKEVEDARVKVVEERKKAFDAKAAEFAPEDLDAGDKKVEEAKASNTTQAYREAAQIFAQCAVRAEERAKAKAQQDRTSLLTARESTPKTPAEDHTESGEQEARGDKMKTADKASAEKQSKKAKTATADSLDQAQDERKEVAVEKVKGEREKAVLIKNDIKEIRRLTATSCSSDEYMKQQAAQHWSIWKAAAEAGSTDAQCLLARCYLDGLTVPKDERTAAKWYRKAADSGSTFGMLGLGYCYINALGVAKDPEEGVKWIKKSADLGDDMAMVTLGGYYYSGSVTTKNSEYAIQLFQKAADLGNALAMACLGDCYYKGDGVAGNLDAAVKWYRKSAEMGDAIAGNTLGCCYRDGISVEKDAKEAVKWFRKAAELGNAEAMNNLGSCYANDAGISQDKQEAITWYRKAAKLGNALAMNNLGLFYENGWGVTQDKDEAVRWYREAVQNGDVAYAPKNLNRLEVSTHAASNSDTDNTPTDPEAQFALAKKYDTGDGVAKDPAKAVEYYKKAAEQGHVRAQYNLGVDYDNGIGVAKDETEAARWYLKAAEQEHAEAQYNLGVCYLNGSGIVKDEGEAVKWFRRAAEHGDVDGQNNLGSCYANGIGVAEDITEAVKWYRKSAEQGDELGQVNLGACYLYGSGIAKDEGEAVKWFLKAAEQGDANGQNNLGFCYANGIGIAKDITEAVKWFRKAAEQGQEDARKALERLVKTPK